jgi:hypothetical protein
MSCNNLLSGNFFYNLGITSISIILLKVILPAGVPIIIGTFALGSLLNLNSIFLVGVYILPLTLITRPSPPLYFNKKSSVILSLIQSTSLDNFLSLVLSSP